MYNVNLNFKNNWSIEDDAGRRNPYLLLVEVELNRAIVEISLEFLKTLKIVLPCNPAISLLGIHPGNSIANNSAICTPYVFCCFIHNSEEL